MDSKQIHRVMIQSGGLETGREMQDRSLYPREKTGDQFEQRDQQQGLLEAEQHLESHDHSC